MDTDFERMQFPGIYNNGLNVISDDDVYKELAAKTHKKAPIMEFNQDAFASRLTLKQRAMYLSVTEAAKQIGISKATLSRLNRGVFLPDVYTYFVCCRWLDVPMEFFFKAQS